MTVATDDNSALDVCDICGHFYLVNHSDPHLKSDVSVVYPIHLLIKSLMHPSCSNTLLMIKYEKPLMKSEQD